MNSSSFWELLYEKYLLNDSIIEDEIEFPNSYPQGTYTINNCAFLNQVSFNDFESEVIFEKCNFKKEILIKSSRPVLKLTFNSCEFLSIDGIPNALINRLNIKNEYNLTFLSKAKINTKVNLIEISNTDFIGLLVLYPNACIISNSKIERLQAYQSQSLKIIDTSIHSSLLSECKNLVTINNSSFKDLQITFSACSLDVQDSTVNNFSLINYNKNKSFLIKNTSITNLIKLKDSNIDDGTFRNCDFSTANMIVEDTNLFNTQFDAIFWKSRSFILDNIMSKKYNNKIDRIDYSYLNKREHLRIQNIYRHLKQAAYNANDKINYNKFKAFELDRYMRTLSFLKRNEWANKLNLCFGRYTNFFTLWWLAPIGYYLLITYILFIILSGFHIPFIPQNCGMILNADFARFLNPTHDLNNIIFFNSKNWLVIMGDYIARILQGLLVYQTIRGFRKPYF